jgi:hypothetical protein
MRHFLLASFILLFVGLTSCDFFKDKQLFSNGKDTLLVYQKKQDSLRFVDSIRTLKKQLNQVKKKHQKMLDSVKKSEQKASSGNKYHVIVGSFTNEEYLRSYNRYVEGKGFKTNIIKNQYGFKMISVQSTNSWKEAVNIVKDMRSTFEETSWIYIQS